MRVDQIYTMMKECVVKKQSDFDKYETIDMTKEYELYKLCYYAMDTIVSHKYTTDELTSFGIPIDDANKYINNKYLMETSLDNNTINMILSYKRNKILTTYVEKNEYVRKLAGLPPLDITVDIKLNEFLSSLDISQIRLDVPIQNLNALEIERVYKLNNTMDLIYEKYPYEFIKYLHRKSDIITIRDTQEYGLIRCGHYLVDSEYEEMFEEIYSKNLNYFKYVLRNTFYESQFVNYDILCILYLIFSTGSQTAIRASHEIISFDDKEFITAYLNSNGIDYIELPQSLMSKFIEQLSLLISLKGSKQCLLNIKDIFDVNSIYRYVLKKNVKLTEYDENTPNSNKYDISFVRVPLEEKNIRKVFENEEYISYTDMVADDPLWGVGDDNLYNQLIETEFNYLETKYISIENMMEITKNTYQYTSLYRYILNNPQLTYDYKFTYKRGNWFEMDVFDAFLYLSLLIIKSRGYQDILPDTIGNISYVMGLSAIDTSHLLWKFTKMFKSEEFRNTPYYMKSMSEVKDVYSFMDVFVNNKKALDIMDKILETTTDYEEYSFIKTIKDSMVISKTLPEIYNDGNGNTFTTYEGYLKFKNSELGKVIDALSIEDNITSYQNEVVYIIDLVNSVLNKESDLSVESNLTILDNIRDEYGGNVNRLLKEVLKYFISIAITIKDFSLVFKIDNESDRFAILEKYKSTGISHRVDKVEVNSDVIYTHESRILSTEFSSDGGVFCVSNRFGIERII